MSYLNSIIDMKRLNLILSNIPTKDRKKLNKRVDKLFKGLTPESEKIISLLDRFNDPQFNLTELPPYNIGNREIFIVNSDKILKSSILNIRKERFIGFDTEQKPTFTTGERQKDISIIQLATKNCCYIFQTQEINNLKPLYDILTDRKIKKVGFDLKNDNREFKKQYNITPENIFDLSPFMKNNLLHKNQIGVKNSVALILLKQMQKSKKMAMSNWENNTLSGSQIKYATEDATAPYDIYNFIEKNFPEILH